MIEHVRRRALLCDGFSDVIVATCDKEIFNVIKQFGGEVMMTSSEHIMASDRVAEAASCLDCTHVVNVQGDEILVMPNDLKKMMDAIREAPDIPYWNAIASIEKVEELNDLAIVKCVVSRSGKIIYCARDFTHLGLKEGYEPVRKILGILAYRRESLFAYGNLQRTSLESTQFIDQSRIIENDIPLESVPFACGYRGINDPCEEKQVREILHSDPVQQKILSVILSES
tara:strand:- start:28 stop:711 length:684 start_codon:yes stop_codon:yes gene_type:complete